MGMHKKRRTTSAMLDAARSRPPRRHEPAFGWADADQDVARCRAEQAKRAERKAAEMAELMAAIERAVAKADAQTPPRRGGRPRRLKDMYLHSDKTEQLTNALARKRWQ